jgi:hypothetical protein
MKDMDNISIVENKEILSNTEKERESIGKEGIEDVRIPAGALKNSILFTKYKINL